MDQNKRNIQPTEIELSQKRRWLKLTICALLVLAVFVVFGQTLGHDFILCDDNVYTYENQHVCEGLTWDSFKWACTTTFAGNWHPLTWLSHILDAQFFGIHQGAERWKGPEAGWHHMTNVLLHAISTILLFLALQRMTGAMWRSAMVAAMFAIHPLRAESVAWAAERKDVLSGMFWMLTMYTYAWYAQKPRIGRYLAVFASLALGLSAKSMLVTLPCVLLLLDYWPLGRWRLGGTAHGDCPNFRGEAGENGTVPLGRSDQPEFPSRPGWWLVVEKLPLFALSASVSAILVYAQQTAGAMNMANTVAYGDRVANALVSSVMYLWKTAWPENLAFFYPHPAVLGKDPLWFTVMQAVFAGMVLAAITWFVILNIRRRPYLSVGWFWYLGTLVPVIGLVQVGLQAMADRYTYIPTIGIYIMTVWGAVEVSERHARFRVALLYGMPILLFFWIVIAIEQVATWRDSKTLFYHAIQVTKDNFFAYNHYGLVFDQFDGNRDTEKAGEQYKIAADIAPNYDSASSNLGGYYARKGDLQKAVGYYENAVRVNQFFYGAHANLGTTYLNLNRVDEAIAEYRKAIELSTAKSADSPVYHGMLALCLLRKGTPESLDEAVAEARNAIELTPRNSELHGILASCLFRKGKSYDALEELRKAFQLNPNNPVTMNDLALTLATNPDSSIRNGEEALQLALRAATMTGEQDPGVLRTLAAAYAETGRFPEALQTASKALDLASRKKNVNTSLIKAINEEINQYKNRKPARMEL
jgi:protein O-mannosyl-transferase